MKKEMSIEDHLVNSAELTSAIKNLKSVFFKCQEHYGKSHSISKKLWNVIKDHGVLTKIESELDHEWHKLVDDETYQKYGNVYYGERRDKNE